MKKFIKVALTAVILISPNQIASAQQLQIPQQGTTAYMTYYTNRYLSSLNMGEMGSEWVAELAGMTRNIDGHSGACIQTDRDGDKVFTTFEGETMTHTLIGGTGKYIGISGSATYSSQELPTHGEGLTSIRTEHKVTWKLK